MLRWSWLRRWLLLMLMGLGAACAPAVPTPATATPLQLASSTPPPTLMAPPSATALPPSPSPLPTVATPSATLGVQTATPIFLPDVDATATALAQAQGTLPPPTTVIAATAPPGVSPAPVTITSFTVTPAEIQPGQMVTLAWQTSAQQVTIYRLDALGRLAEFYNMGPNGSMQLGTPSGQRGQVTFALYATTGALTAQATASAAILCPDTWFFPNPPPECPASPPRATVMQAQDFERGHMLWTQFDDRITLLYADGAQPRWDALANAWFPGQPESDPSLTPPPGFFQPVRGFGVAWRTGYVSPTQVVRDRLGWAINAEYPVPNAQVQCDSLPRYSRCYLTGPGGIVYVLEPERSGWRVWP